MEIRLLSTKDILNIKHLYDDIKLNSITFWDKNYPSDELISYDMKEKDCMVCLRKIL